MPDFLSEGTEVTLEFPDGAEMKGTVTSEETLRGLGARKLTEVHSTEDLAIRREFDGHKSVGSRTVMDAWCAWLAEHGITPAEVWLRGWIERDEVNRRVSYLALVLDEQGRIQLKPMADGSPPGPFEDHELWTEVRTVQLETAPLPFPG